MCTYALIHKFVTKLLEQMESYVVFNKNKIFIPIIYFFICASFPSLGTYTYDCYIQLYFDI